MKKFKSCAFLLLSICMLILSAPLFAGCDIKIKLNEPAFVNFQINSETGDQMLITENNIYASGYVFGISTSYDGTDTSNFLRYKTGRNKHYLDVTNIFHNAQTYYFYAQCVGVSNYLNSDISEVFSYTVQHKLDATSLELSGTTLSWTPVANAGLYIIYANNVVVAEVASNSYDISSFVESRSEKVPYNFTVVCKQNGNYLKSASSNVKTYTDHLNLSAPTNVRVTTSGANKIVSWGAVTNCSKYVVEINGQFQVEVENSNNLNVSSYYTTLGEYSFRVKAIGEGYFVSSDYSSVVVDTYTQKLATPTNVRCVVNTNTVDISWDAVDMANEYLLFINNAQFVLNEDTGVDSPIISNSIVLSFDDLGISQGSQVNSLTIQVQAKGYGYYLSSAKSSGKSVTSVQSVLSAPVLTLQNNLVKISQISQAVSVDIEITSSTSGLLVITLGANNAVDGVITFDYNNQITVAGTYGIKAKANASNSAYDSVYSNTVYVTILEQEVELSSPVLSDVYVSGNYLVVDYSADSNATTNTLLANNAIVTTSLTKSNNKVALSNVLSMVGDVESISFKLTSNAHDHYLESEVSNTYNFSTKLTTAQDVSVTGSTLNWSAVKNAQKYVVAIDDQIVDTESSKTSFDLSSYVSLNSARQILVSAKTTGLTDSDWSNPIIYNNVQTNLTGYTDKYFYYGQTYDYYITSQSELNNLLQYAFDNFIQNVKFYVAFSTSTSNLTKISTAQDNLTGTYGVTNFSVTNGSSKSGACQINITYFDVIDTNTTEPDYKQWQNTTYYVSQTGRDASYNNFVTDTYLVSQDVYETNGLISAVQNKAKPNFVTANSLAERVYNKAKEILRTIVDDNMSDYQKALAIHDYLLKTVSYDHSGLEYMENYSYKFGSHHYVEGALFNGFAVCDGYTKAFSLLCNMEGIHTISISGAVSGAGHAWNKIYLDADSNGVSEWYVVDCTYDDGAFQKGGVTYEIAMHDNFMMPDSIYTNRTENIDYPQASCGNGTYYDVHTIGGYSLTIDTYAKFTQIVSYMQTNNLNGLELLVARNIMASCQETSGISTLAFTYSLDNSYVIMFVY